MKFKILLFCISLFCKGIAQEITQHAPDCYNNDDFSDSRHLFETIEEVLLWGHVSNSLPDIPYNEGKQNADEVVQNTTIANMQPQICNVPSKCILISQEPKVRVKAYPRIKKNQKVDFSPLIKKVDTIIDERINKYGGIACCQDIVRFQTRKEIVEHFTATHFSDGEFKCPYPMCSHDYISDRQAITDHYIKGHFIPYVFACTNAKCTKNYKARSALLVHIKQCNK